MKKIALPPTSLQLHPKPPSPSARSPPNYTVLHSPLSPRVGHIQPRGDSQTQRPRESQRQDNDGHQEVDTAPENLVPVVTTDAACAKEPEGRDKPPKQEKQPCDREYSLLPPC